MKLKNKKEDFLVYFWVHQKAGKGISRAGEGIVRAGYGNKRQDHKNKIGF